MALADALAVSLCAKNVVLLGDPSQLAQVSQGRQPLHAGDSVLQHLLGDEQTVPPDRGIFLDRLVPHAARRSATFISDAMYEERLAAGRSDALTTASRSEATNLAGLYFVPIEHSGNGSSSPEEANEIVRRIALLRGSGMVVDSQPHGDRRGTAAPDRSRRHRRHALQRAAPADR